MLLTQTTMDIVVMNCMSNKYSSKKYQLKYKILYFIILIHLQVVR